MRLKDLKVGEDYELGEYGELAGKKATVLELGIPLPGYSHAGVKVLVHTRRPAGEYTDVLAVPAKCLKQTWTAASEERRAKGEHAAIYAQIHTVLQMARDDLHLALLDHNITGGINITSERSGRTNFQPTPVLSLRFYNPMDVERLVNLLQEKSDE